ncbi:MAG: hypothetical protein CBC09_03865 [Cellvibrionales bacterium TMED49]|nr:DNA polymerase III subunit epsilon [Porticoccaceae bacterium]OUU38957.1 MAG: hypothetical protein CBC09_03865 [Cellvibrionales bacterium TMED49]
MSQDNWFDKKTSAISEGFPDRMVLFDCETTGANATFGKIIEIGLLVIENGVLIDQWRSFCNPETTIPEKIQRLTGINNSMLENAPIFSQIAITLKDYLRDRVLVAHNIRFDYGFLKNEFAREGMKFHEQTLCSVKFSRLLYPQFKSHSLSAIIKRFKFEAKHRHRAMDDAFIIYKFFLKSSELFESGEIAAICNTLQRTSSLPPLLAPKEVEKLPNGPGVYYFYSQLGELLYVGKSVQIRNRVMSHFTQDYRNPKGMRLNAKISSIDYTATPSDFGAQLLENQRIKTLNPLYNRRLRKIKSLFSIRKSENHKGFTTLKIERVELNYANSGSGLFRSPRQAKKKLEELADTHRLCHQLCGLEAPNNSPNNKKCFRSQLQKCFGACVGDECSKAYNQRVALALANYDIKVWPWKSAILVRECDPSDQEHVAFHLIDKWCYLSKITDLQDLLEAGFQPENTEALCATLKEPAPSGEEYCRAETFDLDTYFILSRFICDKNKLLIHNLKLFPLTPI